MRNSPYLRWYFGLFDFVARERLAKNDLDPRIIHAHLTMVLSTGILMWSYTILGLTSFLNGLPGRVGIIASLIHLLSPFLFLVTANAILVCSVALGAGMAHQLTFSYYSGGFDSCVLNWLPILPLLAGFIEGRRSLILWCFLSTLAIGAFFGLQFGRYEFPLMITPNGYLWAKGLLLFGWLFLVLSTTWVHVSMKEFSEEALKSQGKKIDDLFRVLFHDLANSLGRINIGLSLCERETNPPTTARGLQVIRDSQASMSDITQNVRKMYAVSKGKAEIDLALCDLNSSIDHVQRMYATEIEKKKIKIVYDAEKNRNTSILVNPISFNNQVLANILSNAIKFSDTEGTITINAFPAGQNQIALEIKDSGVGMPEVLLKSLFDMNKRTSRPGTAGESGNGFGMHIMKSFLEMNDGQVTIESIDRELNKDSGTSVRLILKGNWK